MSSLGQLLRENETASTAAFLNGGEVRIYSGTAPANADAALSGNTALATHTGLAAAAVGEVVNITVASDEIDATGTATFVRVYVSGNCEYQGEVGVDVTVDDANYVAGGTSNITSFTLTHV